MYLPDKIFINKLLLILLSIVLLISSSIAAIKHIQNKNEQRRIAALNENFLALISDGGYESALELWPEVYTVSKEEQTFLDSFSDCLYDVYNKYYLEKYIYNNPEINSLFETSRVYFDFISKENFNRLTSEIYNQYYYEKIEYEIFLAAENDFAQISRFTSKHLSGLLDTASEIQREREIYHEALLMAESEIPDYQNAINLLNTISPEDTIYYPRAIEKIDEYIIKLRDEVKNNSN